MIPNGMSEWMEYGVVRPALPGLCSSTLALWARPTSSMHLIESEHEDEDEDGGAQERGKL